MSTNHPDIPSQTFEEFIIYGSKRVWCDHEDKYVDQFHEKCLHTLDKKGWKKSTRAQSGVELRRDFGFIAIRDSVLGDSSPVIVVSENEFKNFLDSLR